MARKQANNQKRNLQEQIRKLKSEIEELKIERDESKKSAMFYKQEADMAQCELKNAQEMLKKDNTWSEPPPLVQMEQCQAGLENKTFEDLALQNQALEESRRELGTRLDQSNRYVRQWQEKYDDLYALHMGYEIQIKEIEQAKAREIQLRALNKILRTEISKIKQAQDEALNLEYLKNVVIKFLEMKTTRPQLVPILSALLHCTHEDKTKLHQIVQNNIAV